MYGNGYKTRGASTIGIVPQSGPRKLEKSRRWLVNLLIIGAPILLCAILLLILFLVPGAERKTQLASTRCILSLEANSSNFSAMLQKIETTFFHVLHPRFIYARPGVTPEEIRSVFRPWDPSPSKIKSRTDEANKLLEELNALKINITLLKLRERKALHVAKSILLNNQGWAPYGANYYAGDWMLGPNFFCWDIICTVLYDFNVVISHFKPKNISDLRKLEDIIKQHNETFERYIANLKLGVRAGFVRSKQACEGGIHNMHYTFYRNIALGNETGENNFPPLAFCSLPCNRSMAKEQYFLAFQKDSKKRYIAPSKKKINERKKGRGG